MKDIAIYGAGGFGRELAYLIKLINSSENIWNLLGFFDDGLAFRTKVSDLPVLGGINELNEYERSLAVIIAVGKPQTKKDIFEKVINPNIDFPNLITPWSWFTDRSSVSLGFGNIIIGSSISINVTMGNFNVLNGEVLLGHDVFVGDYNVFSPATKVAGNVHIGNLNSMGMCSVVLQGKKIGDRTTVGANSVIMRNTKNDSLYLGNPATVIQF